MLEREVQLAATPDFTLPALGAVVQPVQPPHPAERRRETYHLHTPPPPASLQAPRTEYAWCFALSSYPSGPCRVYFNSTAAGDWPLTGIVSLIIVIDSHPPLYLYSNGLAGFVS